MLTNLKEINENKRNDQKYDQIQWYMYQLFRFANQGKRHIYLCSSKEVGKICIQQKMRIYFFNDEIIDQMLSKNEHNFQDYFTAPCTYLESSKSRTTENIESFYALLIDIDNIGMDPEDYVEEVNESGIWNSIPSPSFWIGSGGGIYAVYLLNHTTARNKHFHSLYRLVKRRLYELLGGDIHSTDSNHLYRIPGLNNHKYPSAECSIVDFDKIKNSQVSRYYLSDLADSLGYTREFLQEERKQKRFSNVEKKPELVKKSRHHDELNSKNKIVSGWWYTSYRRVQDIKLLVSMRVEIGYDFDGMRNQLLFCYAVYSYYVHYNQVDDNIVYLSIRSDVESLNNMLKEQSLDYHRVEMAVESAKKSVGRLVDQKGKKTKCSQYV